MSAQRDDLIDAADKAMAERMPGQVGPSVRKALATAAVDAVLASSNASGAADRAEVLEAALTRVMASGVLWMRPDLQDVVLTALATPGEQS